MEAVHCPAKSASMATTSTKNSENPWAVRRGRKEGGRLAKRERGGGVVVRVCGEQSVVSVTRQKKLGRCFSQSTRERLILQSNVFTVKTTMHSQHFSDQIKGSTRHATAT